MQKYDQSNAIRYPGRENIPGGAPVMSTTPGYKSSLEGFFRIGDVDLGGEEKSLERDIELLKWFFLKIKK